MTDTQDIAEIRTAEIADDCTRTPAAVLAELFQLQAEEARTALAMHAAKRAYEEANQAHEEAAHRLWIAQLTPAELRVYDLTVQINSAADSGDDAPDSLIDEWAEAVAEMKAEAGPHR